ncbi:MAG: hypothetical protein J6A77_08460 [Lachnospiraceae bacterium]|nr:hypothetical protein [Lachnospiraceae bacterium]
MAEWIMFGVLAGFSVYDLKWKKVNVTAVVIVAATALMYRFFVGTGWVDLFFSLVPGIGLLLLALVTRESIGTGDGLVMCALGIFCGIKPALAILGMALVLCAMLAIILLACRRAGKKTELPFLPCLCAGYLLYLLW